MSVENTSGAVFVRENTRLPTGLAVETEPFLPGWRVVRNLDGYGLGRQVEEAKWNFFYLAGDLKDSRSWPERARNATQSSRTLARKTGRGEV